MPWTKGILRFTMAVIMLSSSKGGPEAFSEMGAAYGTVSESTISFGKLLIGAQGPVSDLRSAEQSDEYRSNDEERFHLAKAKLQRLGSSVHCGNDSMTLHIPGSRMPHFLVDRGDESPVPLSEMPASCGFSLKRVRRDVSLVAPYQGCHVRRQGGSYVLPLVIMGAPAQMSCPTSPRLPTVSCFQSGMIISLGVRADYVKVQVDGSWQPLLLVYSKCSFTLETVGGSLVVTAPFTGSCWDETDMDMQLNLMYGDREVTLSCPVTQPTLAPTTIAPAQDPTNSQQMFYPFPFGRPWWYHPHSHGVRPVPPTVPPTTPPLLDPNQQMFQQMYPMFYPHYFNSRRFPEAPQPQKPRYPMFPPYMYHFKNPVATTTSKTTAAQFPGYPMYPQLYGPQPFVPPGVKNPFKNPVAATTSKTTAARFAGYPMYTQLYGPQPFVPPGVKNPFKNPVAATTSKTTAARFAGYPMYPKFYGPQPFVPPGVKYPFMSQ